MNTIVQRVVPRIVQRIERELGSLKLAITLISIFVVFLAVGTFLESYHGTEFANRLIYKSWPFMTLQFFLFVSILTAMLQRLPPKKRLYGFYSIHIGLILVFMGAYITYDAGIDGSLTLYPNTPTREVTLTRDLFVVNYPKSDRRLSYPLPFKSTPQEIAVTEGDIKAKTFLPFSKNELIWVPFFNPLKRSYHSSQYLLSNKMVSQEVTVGLNPDSPDFPASVTLGPLNIHYLPQEIFPCMQKLNSSTTAILFWDSEKQTCFTPEERGIPIKKTSRGNRFTAFQYDSEIYTFFPDMNPWPVTRNFETMENSTLKVLSLLSFQEKPHLFLFGLGVAYFTEGKWQTASFDPSQNKNQSQNQDKNQSKSRSKSKKITLPWMNFNLQLKQHYQDKRPEWRPQFVKPIQDQGQTIEGDQKALLISVKNQDYWVRSDRPLSLLIDGQPVTLELKKETLDLPFEINLDQFKMETDPGTNNPASFESFVTLFHESGHQRAHVYMNNPLKFQFFTFYQASYFPTDEGHGSVFSVNFDPGRPFKYFGSLMLVLGAILHYFLNRDRFKQKNQLAQQLVQQTEPATYSSPSEVVIP